MPHGLHPICYLRNPLKGVSIMALVPNLSTTVRAAEYAERSKSSRQDQAFFLMVACRFELSCTIFDHIGSWPNPEQAKLTRLSVSINLMKHYMYYWRRFCSFTNLRIDFQGSKQGPPYRFCHPSRGRTSSAIYKSYIVYPNSHCGPISRLICTKKTPRSLVCTITGNTAVGIWSGIWVRPRWLWRTAGSTDWFRHDPVCAQRSAMTRS